ncbi:MAG: hypothetical protein HYY26_04525 [Acidobacteria bacterium]|nr:hypothetical protein [Acidobacteriota bacterium]
MTALDLDARQVIFRQDNLAQLDWPRLRQALDEMNPRLVSLDQLAGRKQKGAFFREVLAERLRLACDASAGAAKASRPESPRRVFIVLSSHILFPQGSELRPVDVPAGCRCRVYHLRYQMAQATWDELGKVMKPLKPRRFDLRSPHDLRKALARILADLRKL